MADETKQTKTRRPDTRIRSLARRMPFLVMIVAAVAAFGACSSDDATTRDDPNATIVERPDSDEPEIEPADGELEREAEEVAQRTERSIERAGEEVEEETAELGDAMERTAKKGGKAVRKGVRKVGEGLRKLGIELEEGADDFSTDARAALGEIESETEQMREDLRYLGDDADDAFLREVKELEARSAELRREMDQLDARGEAAWDDARRSMRTSLDRLAADVARFGEEIDVDDEHKENVEIEVEDEAPSSAPDDNLNKEKR